MGGKGLNLSTFAELLQYLEVPMSVLNDISHYYLETILQNTQKIRTVVRRILKNSVEYQEHSRMRKQAIEHLR